MMLIFGAVSVAADNIVRNANQKYQVFDGNDFWGMTCHLLPSLFKDERFFSVYPKKTRRVSLVTRRNNGLPSAFSCPVFDAEIQTRGSFFLVTFQQIVLKAIQNPTALYPA